VGDYSPPSQLPGLLDLEKTALDDRPELAAISATIGQSETRTQLAEKSFKPDYTISGGYMLMPNESRYRNTYMAELSVTLPWLNRGRHNAEIAEASAIVAAEKAEYESRRAALFAEIQESLVRARVAQRLVGLYRDTLRPQAHAVLKATVAAYQADRTDYLNLLDSQNTTLDVELDYIRAVSDLETRMADLERAVGAPLPRRLKTNSSDSIEHETVNVQVRQEVKQMTKRERYLIVAGTVLGLLIASLLFGVSRLIRPEATTANTEAATPSAYESSTDNAPVQQDAHEHGSAATPGTTQPLSSLQLTEDEQRSIGLQTTVVQRQSIRRELLAAARVEEPETQLAISALASAGASRSCTWISPGSLCGVASRLPRSTVRKCSLPPRSTDWRLKTANGSAVRLSLKRSRELTI
jgi:hypothetical protein